MKYELKNTFKEAISRKDRQIGLWLATANSYMAEISATAGYDWLLIDAEHAPNSVDTLLKQLQAIAPYPSHPIIRPLETTQANIKQILDLGAMTILLPMIETEEQAKAAVEFAKYPPYGSRGVGAGIARASRWGRISNYMKEVNDSLCILIQVETKEAIKNLDEILSVEGIDGVFIGPADLAASLGYPDDIMNPVVQEIIKNTIEIIQSKGKATGILALNNEMIQNSKDQGIDFIAIGVDTILYTEALDSHLENFKCGIDSKLEMNKSY